MPNQKFSINVDGNEDMSTLENQIAEKLQYKLDFLNGITELMIKNVRKVGSQKSRLRGSSPFIESLPTEGQIYSWIQEEEVLKWDLEAREIWIKAIIVINYSDKINKKSEKEENNNSFQTEVSLKLGLKSYIHEFKQIIQKLVYFVWNKFWSEVRSRREDNYFLKDIKYELSWDGLDLMTQRHQRDQYKHMYKGGNASLDIDQDYSNKHATKVFHQLVTYRQMQISIAKILRNQDKTTNLIHRWASIDRFTAIGIKWGYRQWEDLLLDSIVSLQFT